VTIIEQGGEPTAATDLIKDVTTETFVQDVVEESRRQPVLIDFWAPWCGPCKQLTPVLEKAVKAAKGRVRLAKMNIDEHPTIPTQMGIQSIPAVIAFVNASRPTGSGRAARAQINAFIARLTKNMPAPEGSIEEALQDAAAAAAAGDAQAAAAIYSEVLAQDAANVAALAGLARLQAEAGALDRAKETLAKVAADKREDAAVKAVQAILDLAEQAKSLGPITELEQKVAADPADHQARFDLALALNAEGRRADAAQHLVEIVRRARSWNDDSARKQLLQFFEAWGPTDEATVEGRRKLSSVLFA